MERKNNGWGTAVCLLGIALFGFASRSLADTEIDLNDLAEPSPTPKTVSMPTSAPVQAEPTPVPNQAVLQAPPPPPKTAATPTPAPVSKDEDETDETSTSPNQQAAEPAPTAYEIQGREKMKDVYEAGINSYKEQDYDRAIRFLNQALKMENDPYTPKFYYAEANAMLGVIYQFHIIRYKKAYDCYRAALKFEPKNETALRHIKEVRKYRDSEE